MFKNTTFRPVVLGCGCGCSSCGAGGTHCGDPRSGCR